MKTPKDPQYPGLSEFVCVVVGRRFPTLPHPSGCSTIGVGGLSFRVRNGSGRFPAAVDHRHRVWGAHTLVVVCGCCGVSDTG